MEILKVHNLSKVYGKGDTQIKAMDDVSFSVEKGEFVAIVGPSGSGKSTLLHILGGVDTPSSGQVLVDGTDICALDQTKLAIFRRRQIGLIYQFYNLIPILNVEENITLPLLLDGRSLDEARLKEIVATLGLADRVRHLPNQLSGGQQQRVSIGRALINNPALVLADEPTGNLDSSQLQGDHRAAQALQPALPPDADRGDPRPRHRPAGRPHHLLRRRAHRARRGGAGMNILTTYTLKYLRLNKKRTAVTILGVILSSALICGVFLLGVSFQKVMIDHEIFMSGNWHAQFLAVPYAKAKYITENSAVQTAMLSASLGNATYGSHNTVRPYLYITAYDALSFQNQSIKLISGRFPQNGDELLISPVMVSGLWPGLETWLHIAPGFWQAEYPQLR